MSDVSRRGFLKGALGSTAGAGTALARKRLHIPASHAAAGVPTAGAAGSARATSAAGALAPRTSVAPGPFVLCTLYGGNDGLNTVVPYEEDAYTALRGALAITPDEALPLGTLDDVALGLHPSLTTLHSLWETGQVAIILGVEYPDPNFSHFESMDIWQTADLSGEAGSGWIGRWLDTGTDPLRALSVGSQVPMAMAGNIQQAGTLADSTSGQSQLPYGDTLFASAYRKLMTAYHREAPIEAAVSQNGTNLLTVGTDAANALNHETPPTPSSGRDGGDIANQFAIVAELIEYGLPTQVYGVSFGSFDTHADQADMHAGLLSQLDTGLEVFFQPFGTATVGKSPVVLIYSEFGRTPQANSSGGTDHSSSSVVFAVGPSVRGGFYGELPSLTKFDQYGNFLVTTDFRRIYATILEDILGIEAKDILGKKFGPVNFL